MSRDILSTMSDRTRFRATLIFKMLALVCLVIAVAFPVWHTAYAQRGGYAATAEDQRRDDNIETITKQMDQNRDSSASTWRAINDVKTELHQMEVEQASTKFVTTGFSGTGVLGLLVSIGLQIRKKSGGDKDGQ